MQAADAWVGVQATDACAQAASWACFILGMEIAISPRAGLPSEARGVPSGLAAADDVRRLLGGRLLVRRPAAPPG